MKNVEIPKDLIFIYRQLNTQNINLLQFNMSVQSGIQLIFKRILDLVASVVLLFVLSPLIIFLCVYIYFHDFHNPLISIKRSGKNGKEFAMYKFRTMKPSTHEDRTALEQINTRKGPLFKIENDPRIIKSLNWLRIYSLDELPQLFNVIKGDMSLVGPRPLFAEDLVKFTNEQTLRLSVLPGITGLLQINARETDDFNLWFKYDKEYIDTWSLLLDCKILLLTPFTFFKKSL